MTKFIKKKSVNTALSKFKKFPTIGALLILVVVSTLYSIEFHNPLTITDSNPTILDGDTVRTSQNITIRLKRIDSPEIKQYCSLPNNEKWSCGISAREKLREYIGKSDINCSNEGVDIYKRVLSYCFANNINLNKEMILSGYAVSYNNEFFLKYYFHLT